MDLFRRNRDGKAEDKAKAKDKTDPLATPPGLPAEAARVWSNPALLCDEEVAAERLRELISRWNPAVENGAGTEFDRSPLGGAIAFSGPVTLTPEVQDELQVDRQWKVAYIAEVPRRRVPASVAELVERFPNGLPIDDEDSAWDLVQGLAARLGGAARLPGSPVACPRGDQTLLTVYGPKGLSPDELTTVLPESLSSLVLVDLEDFRDGEWLSYRLEDAAGALFIDAERMTEDFVDDLPFAVRTRSRGTSDVFQYDLGVAGEGTARDRLRYQFARALVTASDGVLVDEFGFIVPLDNLTGDHWASSLW